MNPGKRYGIQSFDDIRERCVVDELTGHWHWKGAFTVNAKGSYPTTWIPALQRTGSIPSVIQCILGKELPPGKIRYRACDAADCANPAHFKVGTWGEKARKSRPTNTAIHNAKISAKQRARFGNEQPVLAATASVFNLAATMGMA